MPVASIACGVELNSGEEQEQWVALDRVSVSLLVIMLLAAVSYN